MSTANLSENPYLQYFIGFPGYQEEAPFDVSTLALFRKSITAEILYGQQKYKVHSVDHRIVSITQPWIRPIVRGKAKAPVEFGAKFDHSLDSEGYGHIEKISFEAYNESACLIETVKRVETRTSRPNLLARENRNHCKAHGIRISSPKLGRPGVNTKAGTLRSFISVPIWGEMLPLGDANICLISRH